MIFLKKERILRYFVYDIINNINTTDKITIKEFKYDSKTLVNSFYHELLNILSGESVRFPSRIEIRNQQICQEYWSGSSVPELAEQYGLSQQTIYKIIEKVKKSG